MRKKSNLQEVKALATSIGNEMSDMEFFLSKSVRKHFADLVMALTQRYGDTKVSVEIQNTDKDVTAYTDHRRIVINANCGMFDGLARPNKFLAISGICFHETAHCLYTNKEMVYNIIEELKNTNTLLCAPTVEWDELKKLLESGKKTNSFISVWKQIWNTLEDGYIEYRFLDEHQNRQFKNGLVALRNLHKSTFQSLESYIKEETDDSKKLITIENLLLAYCKYGIMIYDDKKQLQDERVQALLQCMPFIDEVNATYDSDSHYIAINNVIATLSPFIVDYLNNQPDDKDGGGNATEQEQSQIGDKSGSSDAPSNKSEAQKPMAGDGNSSQTEKGSENKTPSDNGKDPEPSELTDEAMEEAKKKMEKLLNDEAEEKAQQQLEHQAAQELAKIDSTIDKGDLHSGISSISHRVLDIPDRAKDDYEVLKPKINQLVKAMVKGVKQVLKDRRTGGVQRGLYFGKSISPVSYSRSDKKYFQNKKLPTNAPTMSVALVVDESGSMSTSGRIEAAKILALTLYQFCRELDIRICIVGHSTSGDDVALYQYCDFNGSFDNKDLYRILTMQPRGRNRDGYAIRHVIGRLAKEEADMKLCFVVSDGKPNHYGYHTSEALSDFAGIKKICHSKHINLIAAAIGEDKDVIKSFYGEDSFLDITDLDALPKAVIEKIKKYLPKTI